MFRKATVQDFDDVYALMCVLEETEFNKEEMLHIFQKQCADPHYYALVYDDGKHVKGVLNMRFEYQLHHCGKIAEILEFVILDDCRNMGIGKQMLQEAIRIANEKQCMQIELDSDQKRIDAHRFYEKNGFLKTHYKFVKDMFR